MGETVPLESVEADVMFPFDVNQLKIALRTQTTHQSSEATSRPAHSSGVDRSLGHKERCIICCSGNHDAGGIIMYLWGGIFVAGGHLACRCVWVGLGCGGVGCSFGDIVRL